MKIDLTQPWSGRVAVESVCRNTAQPRVHFDVPLLEKLGRSMKRKQQAPCPVIPYQDKHRPAVQWMLVDGERRWRAAQTVGLKTLWVCYEPGVTDENLHESSLAANFNREGHTKMDTARALQKEIDAGRTVDELADVVGKSNTWVTMHLSLMKLHAELQVMMDPPTPKDRRISLSVAGALSAYPKEKQMALFAKHCAGRKEGAALAVLRTSAGAARSSTRDTDAQYAFGRIKSAFQTVRELNVLGDKILGKLSPEKAAEALVMLEQIRADVVPIKLKLEAITG
jgi:ParB/RepB/Spo0J family partition protein